MERKVNEFIKVMSDYLDVLFSAADFSLDYFRLNFAHSSLSGISAALGF